MIEFQSWILFALVLFCGPILLLMPKWRWFILCASIYIISTAYIVYDISNIPPEDDHGGAPIIIATLYFFWVILWLMIVIPIKVSLFSKKSKPFDPKSFE
jgi:hypothetical protein